MSDPALTKESYDKALKTVRAQKVPATYGHLSLHWDFRNLILPYAKAVQLMALLEEAHAYKDSYSDKPVLRPLEGADIEMKLMPQQLFDDIRVAQLLNLPLKEVQAASQPETSSA